MSDNLLQIVFAGTQIFSVQHLSFLYQANYRIVGILTQPDKRSGRGNKIIENPVKRFAKEHNLPIFQPHSLNIFEMEKWINMLNANIVVVVSYGLIFPESVLKLPKFGCINLHCSLLPRWRGAAPVQRAILSGDNQTGVTIIQMDSGIDTGEVLYSSSCLIQPDDTSFSLFEKLSIIGQNALKVVLNKISSKSILPIQQDNSFATYAKKINKSEAKIDWNLSAIQIDRCIRAFNPWPFSYFFLFHQIIKIRQAHIERKKTQLNGNLSPGTILFIDKNGIVVLTGNGSIKLTSLQIAGRKAMSVKDILNSRPTLFVQGTILK